MTDDERRDRWDGLLARLALSSRIDLTATADELLAQEAGRRHVEARLTDAEFGEAAWRIAQYDVENLCRTASGDWIARALSWLNAGEASWQRSARFCADVSWTARSCQNSALLYLGSHDVPAAGINTPVERGKLHLILQSQRYDFRFASIIDSIRMTGLRAEDLDPFSRAVHIFALLGSNAPNAITEMDRLEEDERGNEKVAHALLHGLWFADGLEDQAERIISLIEGTPALRLEDSTVALRRAYALRKLHRFEEAAGSIDLGLLHLSPAATDVHQDFARERAMISVVRDIEDTFARERRILGEDARSHLDDITSLTDVRISKIEDKISDSLFKVVEILALFTAMIALLAAGGASVAIGSLEWWQRLLLILTAGGVVLMLFVAIRVVVRPSRGRPRE